MTQKTKRTRKRMPRWLVLLLGLGAVGVGLPCLMTRVLFTSWAQEGPSMEPSLPDGARYFGSRLSEPSRGDVVVIEDLDGVTTGKRVVAVAGDRVEIVDDLVVLNGTPLAGADLGPAEPAEGGLHCHLEGTGETRWLVLVDPARAESHPEVTVPPGHVYVLGDHRARSKDSRTLGPLPAAKVRAVLAWIYHPGAAADSPRCTRTDPG